MASSPTVAARVITKNPSDFKEDTLASGETQNLRPVDSVNWYQAVAFCNELTKQTMGNEYCVYYTDESHSTVYTANDANSKTLPYFRLRRLPWKHYRYLHAAAFGIFSPVPDEISIPYPNGDYNLLSSYAYFSCFYTGSHFVRFNWILTDTPNLVFQFIYPDFIFSILSYCLSYRLCKSKTFYS